MNFLPFLIVLFLLPFIFVFLYPRYKKFKKNLDGPNSSEQFSNNIDLIKYINANNLFRLKFISEVFLAIIFLVLVYYELDLMLN